jgi:hypothetical protein
MVMLRAFLVVWTLVAGVAAGGLLYIVGWRPQTTVVADRLTSPSNPAGARATTPPRSGTTGESIWASTSTPTTQTAAAPEKIASTRPSSQPWADVAPHDPNSADNPASTGSIGRAPDRPLRKAASADGRPEASAPTAQDVSQKLGANPGKPVASDARAAAVSSEPKSASAPELSRRLSAASPGAPADMGGEAGVADGSNRALKPRARAAKAETVKTAETVKAQVGRAPERMRRPKPETPRVTALAQERSARPGASETPRRLRQQARMGQRMRVARRESREGSLEQVMDDFSQSGADFLHERTMRVGNRYVVERTTRLGTQYFYEQSMR